MTPAYQKLCCKPTLYGSVLCFSWFGRTEFKSTSGCRRQNYRVTFDKLGFLILQLYLQKFISSSVFSLPKCKVALKMNDFQIGKLQYFSTFIPIYVMDTKERSHVRFPANNGSVRKGIRPQMLLCHTSIQVRRPALILEIKNQVTPRFLTEYHRVSRL